jgi:hypothetical protein
MASVIAALKNRQPASSPAPQLATSSYPPARLLLNDAAGSFTGKDATDALAEFAKAIKQQNPEALAELSRLAASGEVSERLLATHIALEVNGPATAALTAALADPSPAVTAQAAEWLYFYFGNFFAIFLRRSISLERAACLARMEAST